MVSAVKPSSVQSEYLMIQDEEEQINKLNQGENTCTQQQPELSTHVSDQFEVVVTLLL